METDGDYGVQSGDESVSFLLYTHDKWIIPLCVCIFKSQDVDMFVVALCPLVFCV